MRTKLKQIRSSYGFTQYTIADALNISRSHYAQVETGDKSPSLKLAIRIKELLNYPGDDIFDNL